MCSINILSAKCKYGNKVGWAPGSHLDFPRTGSGTQVNTGVDVSDVQYAILKLYTKSSCNGHFN